jgi:hypothetical protein
MIRVLIAVFFGCLLSPSIWAQEQEPYWTERFIQDRVAPFTKAISRCHIAWNEQEMKSHLSAVGWPLRASKPTINWSEDVPVIISPGTEYLGFQLEFIDLKRAGKEFTLRWGWWDAYRKQYRGSSTLTLGSGTPTWQILIVAVKRYVPVKYKLFCQEYVAR